MDRNISFIPHGEYKFYYDDEQLNIKVNGRFNHGVLDGHFTYYYPNNNKMYELDLKDGIKNGECFIYNNQGILATKILYENDVVKKINLYFPKQSDDGSIVPIMYAEYNMNGSLLHGPFRDLTKNEMIRRIGEYQESNYYNFLKMYYENTPLLIFEDKYDGRSLINKKLYDRVGRILNDINYSKDLKKDAKQYFYTEILENKYISYKFINNTVEVIQLK